MMAKSFTPRRTLALLLAALCGAAQAITFEQAYEAALKNDPTFRMDYYENQFGQENAVIGRAGLLPQVGINYSANKNRVDQTAVIAGRDVLSHPEYVSRNAAITVRQPILDLEAVARYRQGKVQTAQSDALFDARKAEMVLRVAGAYLDALLAEDALALAKAQRDTYAEQAKVNQRLFEKGEGTRTDMLETAARLDQAEAQVLEAQDNVTVNRNTLAALIGQDPGALQQLAVPYRPQPLSPAGFDEWRAIAIENNGDIKAARLATEVARLEIQKARAGHAPRVDVVGSYSKTKAETVNTFDQSNLNRSVGVQLNVPLYSGGQVSAVTRQAVAAFERAKADLEVRTDRVLIELRKAHSTAVSNVARVAALEKAVASGELLTRATEQSIKGGVRINLDLLTAQQQLTASRRDLAQARYTHLLSLLRLRAAAGTLTRADVQEVARFFR